MENTGYDNLSLYKKTDMGVFFVFSILQFNTYSLTRSNDYFKTNIDYHNYCISGEPVVMPLFVSFKMQGAIPASVAP